MNTLFDPTERNAHPFLIPTRARAMKELVLALAIHDKGCHHGQANTSGLQHPDKTDASI